LALLFCLIAGDSFVFAGNTFVIGDLRFDLPEIHNAGDYRLNILPVAQPSTGDLRNFSTAWLGVLLHEYDGTVGSGAFSQVGVMTTQEGVQWFVYAEPGVVCWRGTQTDPRSCYGDYNDLVSLNSWTSVRLYKSTQTHLWIAGVYDNSNGEIVPVAEIFNASDRIWLARADTEEGYCEQDDPFIALQFFLHHPMYQYQGDWNDWAESDSTGQSFLHTYPIDTTCPDHYGATPNINGDERFWYAGTGGTVCGWLLFPSEHTYLPLIVK
jgi:hypothetical protein